MLNNTKVNPREHVNLATLNIGKELNQLKLKKKIKNKKNATKEEKSKEV